MKWLVAAPFIQLALGACLRKTQAAKAKTEVRTQNPFVLVALPSIQQTHANPVPGIKALSNSHAFHKYRTIPERNETGKNETKENETQSNETRGNETRENKTGQNETKGNETGEDNMENDDDSASADGMDDIQYTIKSVKTSSPGTQHLYVKTSGSVDTMNNADGDECKWTLYTGLNGGITIANVKWPDRHLSIIYETGVNQQSWKYVANTCRDDEKCYDEWEFYALEGTAEGVMMYLIAENRFLEEDCSSNQSPTKAGLWVFDPPLPADMVKGEKEEDLGIVENIFR